MAPTGEKETCLRRPISTESGGVLTALQYQAASLPFVGELQAASLADEKIVSTFSSQTRFLTEYDISGFISR